MKQLETEQSPTRPKKSELITFEDKGAIDGLSNDEMQHRLVNILKKMISPDESLNRFTKVKNPGADLFKELIFEISSKVDDMQIEIKRGKTRISWPENQ